VRGGVDGEQVDPVAGMRGQAGQQQRRVDRVVQAWLAVGVQGVGDRGDPAGTGTARVDDAQHPAVAFRAPLLYRHVFASGGGPPVDRPRVIADDVVA